MKDHFKLAFSKRVKRILARRKYAISKINELTQLADLLGSDKGTRLSGHLYTRIYDKFFKRLRHSPISLLEIGLMRTDIDARRWGNAAEGNSLASSFGAPSLEMWRTYFPNATLYGFDIDDFSNVKIDGCTILRGDVGSRDSLRELIRTISNPIDIVIDDASHASHHQQLSLGLLFPKVAPGGMYVIEDLHWQDHRFEKSDAPKTRQLLRQLQVQGTFNSPCLSDEEQKYIESNVENIWLFDSFTTEVDDPSDALAILKKR